MVSCSLLCHCNLSISLSPIVIASGFSSLICPSLFQIAVFCPGKSPSSPAGPAGEAVPAGARRHCLVLLLRKENARHHIPALLTGNACPAQQPGKESLHFNVCEFHISSPTTAIQCREYLFGISRPAHVAVGISRTTCESVTTTHPTELPDLCQLFDL